MTNSIIILDHPYTLISKDNVPHRRSFSAAICHALIEANQKQGFNVNIIDLHADHFDPVMHADDLTNWRLNRQLSPQIDAYNEQLKMADNVFIVFPIWWGSMPAMMQGFFDKVLRKSDFLNFHNQTPLFQPHTKVFVYTVSGAPTDVYVNKLKQPILPLLTVNTFYKLGVANDNYHWQNINAEDISEQKRQIVLTTILNNKF
ncbi:NAD(P)H-dependent oxidoreductase [Leuconostoc suionicum]|uniref:NAD(P)H-dependent oxidoreductase n=1 Tax=Leuconostoc suionicum TaxID=1511761 RepID=UPI001B8D948C|nr:NAD(P)H-dependent oxidoreductase [Leuconostoc suionicum]MBS1008079.1 NAD(P)H-dependent oxidoreductase [Leuconostoc suionicum]